MSSIYEAVIKKQGVGVQLQELKAVMERTSSAIDGYNVEEIQKSLADIIIIMEQFKMVMPEIEGYRVDRIIELSNEIG